MIQKQFYSKQNRQDVGFTEIQSAQCPFDSTHLCLPEKLYTHIMRCKSPNKKFYVKCKYSQLHYIYPDQKKKHQASCPNKDKFLEDYRSDQDWEEQEQRIKRMKQKKSKQNLSLIQEYSNVLPQQSISKMKSMIAEDSMMHKINLIQKQLDRKNKAQQSKKNPLKKTNLEKIENVKENVKKKEIYQQQPSIEQSQQMYEDQYSGYDQNQDYYGDDEYSNNQSSQNYYSTNKIDQSLSQQNIKNIKNNQKKVQKTPQRQNVVDPRFLSLYHFPQPLNKNQKSSPPTNSEFQLLAYYCYYFLNQFDNRYYDSNGMLCQIFDINGQLALKIKEQYYPMANIQPIPNPNYFIDVNTNQMMMVIAILITKKSYEINFLGNTNSNANMVPQQPAKKKKKKRKKKKNNANQVQVQNNDVQKKQELRQVKQQVDLMDQVKNFIKQSKQNQQKQKLDSQNQKPNIIKNMQNTNNKYQRFYQQSSSYSQYSQLQAVYDNSISFQKKSSQNNLQKSKLNMSQFVQDDLETYGRKPNFNKYKASEQQMKIYERKKRQMEQYQARMKQKRNQKILMQKLNELSIIQKKKEQPQDYTMQKFSILDDF